MPSCIHSFWHGVVPTSYFIFNDFYTCFTNFYLHVGLALTVGRGEMPYVVRALYTCIAYTYMYEHPYCTRELNGSCDVYVQSTIKWHRSKRKSPRWTWILLSEGTDTSRTKIRLSHVKIIVFKPLIWTVEHLY